MVCVLVAVLKYERVGIEVKSETSKPSERAKTVAKRFLQGGKAIESQHPPSMAFPFVCLMLMFVFVLVLLRGLLPTWTSLLLVGTSLLMLR